MDTKRNYEKDIKPHFGKMLMSDVDSLMILSWFNKLTGTEGRGQPLLINFESYVLLCMALGVCKHNPCLPIKKNPTRKEQVISPKAN